jgi:hypothetical protein
MLNKKILAILTGLLLLTVSISFSSASCFGNPTNPASVAPKSSAPLLSNYRVERDGWIYVRIEGKPFERGFQYGYCCADRINESIEVLSYDVQHNGLPWDYLRYCSKELCWRNIPPEYQQEIMGIAAGVRARGYRNVDWVDILTSNALFEVVSYLNWLLYTGQPLPEYSGWQLKPEHFVLPEIGGCSAFIATGSYTKDGEIVAAHNSWSGYMTSQFFNTILYIKPESGHAILMQCYAGWIWSGTDWAMNDAGLLLSETTISGVVTYNPDGIPVFVRERYGMQYTDNIDDLIEVMNTSNTGGYANMWIIGDAKTGEIATMELAVNLTGESICAVRRTFDGFYGSCNYPLDDRIREEAALLFDWTDPSTSEYSRYVRWGQLETLYKGEIDVELAKKFALADHYDTYLELRDHPCDRTLCGHGEDARAWDFYPMGAFDGKATDTTLILEMKTWARWGHPCGIPFDAEAFLAAHPVYEWQRPYLVDYPTRPWSLFEAA